MTDYLSEIIERFKKQAAKGFKKYGQYLEDNDRPATEALEYLAEELTDGLMYIQEAIAKLKEAERSVNRTD